jgi:uncharacterized membrane protein
MLWEMRSKSSLLALGLVLWWIFVNLPWLSVGAEQFTGGQLIPVLNLLPAIALTAVFISFYGKFRRSLTFFVVLVVGLGIFISLSQNLETSAVVIADLERLSGVLNPESHEAGVAITQLWGKLAAIALNIAALIAGVASLTASTSGKADTSKTQDSQDNRSLWDEQN